MNSFSLSTFVDGTLELPGTGAVRLLAPGLTPGPAEIVFFVAAAQRFEHVQASPATEWVVNHNLGTVPSVTVYSPGLVQITAEVSHTSTNQTRIRFNTPQTGIAVLH
jgi:hypothetical protein